jgi:hypothetical protein
MPDQNPEQLEHDRKNLVLLQSGWVIQDKKKINPELKGWSDL